MERLTRITIAVAAIGLALGWLMEPVITVMTGVCLWLFILLLLGGAEDPNPARTSIRLHGGIPDRPLVHRAMKPVEVQKEKNIRGRHVWMLVISGGFLVAVGIIRMYGAGLW